MGQYKGAIRLRYVLVFLISIVILGFFIFSSRTSLVGDILTVNLLPKEEAITELYFEEVPKFTVDEKGIRVVAFSFAIHNEEGRVVTYPYQIVLTQDSTEPKVFAEDSVILRDDEMHSVDVSFPSAKLRTEAFVEVLLIGRNESLHYRLVVE